MTHQQLLEYQKLYETFDNNQKYALRNYAKKSLREKGFEEFGSSDVSVEVLGLLHEANGDVSKVINHIYTHNLY
jgi:hypothetical protein